MDISARFLSDFNMKKIIVSFCLCFSSCISFIEIDEKCLELENGTELIWRKTIGIIDQNYDDMIIVKQKQRKDTFFFKKNSIADIFVNINRSKVLIVSDSIQVNTICQEYPFINQIKKLPKGDN